VAGKFAAYSRMDLIMNRFMKGNSQTHDQSRTQAFLPSANPPNTTCRQPEKLETEPDPPLMKNRRQGSGRCRQIFSHFCQQKVFSVFFLPSLALLIALSASAQNQDVNSLFPDPARVTADYPDEVDRYAAFSTLYDTLMADAPKPMSSANYQKSSTYMATYNAIDSQHMMAGIQSQAYKDWAAQRDKKIDDFTFRRSVLERYELTALQPIARPPPPTYTAPPAGDVQIPGQTYRPPADPVHRLLLYAMPLAILSWAGMFMLPWLMMCRSGIKSRFTTPPAQEKIDGLAQPPESLRVIQLPGVRYYTKTFSGLLLNKETTVYTSAITTTTPERVENIGNMTYRTPGQTTTSYSRRRVDTLRIRTPDGHESTWTLTGNSGDRIFNGQILTGIARPVKADFSEFVLVYNHNTAEFVRVEEGLSSAHRPGWIMGWLAQPVSVLAGTPGFAIVIGYLLTFPPPVIQIRWDMSGVILLLMGGFCSLTVAFFLVLGLKARLVNRRSAQLLARYGPQFRQYLDQLTPGLKQLFGIR
jgi:hypothetical protein